MGRRGFGEGSLGKWKLTWREGLVRGEVVQDVGARAPAKRCFPGSKVDGVGDVELVAFVEDEEFGILGSVPVNGPVAGVDSVAQ